jgi:hypothetical protein
MKLLNTKSPSPNNTNNVKEPSSTSTKITCVYIPTNHVGSFCYHFHASAMGGGGGSYLLQYDLALTSNPSSPRIFWNFGSNGKSMLDCARAHTCAFLLFNHNIDKENKITHSWLIMPQHLVTIIQWLSSLEWKEKMVRSMKYWWCRCCDGDCNNYFYSSCN